MKNKLTTNTGFILPLVIAIIVIVVAGAIIVGKNHRGSDSSVASSTDSTSSTASSTDATASSTSSTSHVGFKTYTNSKYGYTFQYPQTWKVTGAADSDTVKVESNIQAKNYNAFILTIQAVKNSAFVATNTKWGKIAYDESKCALVDTASNPIRVLPTVYQSGANVTGRTDFPVILYGGSNMSDPATADIALLTNKDYMIEFHVADETTGSDSTDNIVKAAAGALYNTFTLTNGVTARVPGCAK